MSGHGGHDAHGVREQQPDHEQRGAEDAGGRERHPGQGAQAGESSEGRGSHDAHEHHGHSPEGFRRTFWVSLVLTVPTLVFSHGLQELLGLDGPRFPGSQWIPAVFGIVLFLYGGRVFLVGAFQELRGRAPGMMTLISLAILVAFGYSLAVTLGLEGMDFWWELSTLITIMLFGHWIELSAVSGAQNALGELARLIPDEAERVDGEETALVGIADLSAGDRVLVRPGARLPVDGEIVDGETEVDESLLTGESAAVPKRAGDRVIAGSVNGMGSITVTVTGSGDDTAFAGVMRMVADAQASKSGSQLLADRAAAWLFYLAIGVSFLTLIAWALLRPGDPAFVLERVVTVLVVACPHALGLAIPLVAQISTAIGARNGLLVRNRLALEQARNVDVVLFDKTGTLTRGEQTVTEFVCAEGLSAEEVLGLAAAVEARAEHPIGKAIVAEAKARKAKRPRASGFEALAGRGVSAVVNGHRITVAGDRTLAERGIRLPTELVHASREAAARGSTLVYVVDDTTALGMFALDDEVREESLEAVRRLQRRGVRVAIITGDSHAVGAHVGRVLGIDEVHSSVLPGQKADAVRELQADGSVVAMVGDGVNDAPALAQADIGIAIGAGTDVAIESAGVVLASSDPRGVLRALNLSRATYRKMWENLLWATGYNIVALPLAAGVLAGLGVLLSPAVGAILMSVSTVVVAVNAQLLRRVRLD